MGSHSQAEDAPRACSSPAAAGMDGSPACSGAEEEAMSFVECETCGGSGSTECGAIHPGACDSDGCHGHCEEPCPDCTGEGMVQEG